MSKRFMMAISTLQDIEHAIGTLTKQELEELYGWLDQHQHPFDARIQSDLASGHLDKAIQQALSDEQHDRVQPL